MECINSWDTFCPWIDIENPSEVFAQKISIIELLDYYGIEYIHGGGEQYKARCPFHANGEERTPSMYIYNDTASFHCFACQANGNIVDFVIRQLGFDPAKKGFGFNKAVDELAKITGIISTDSVKFTLAKKKIIKEETIEYWIGKCGVEIRNFLFSHKDHTEYNKWAGWAEKRFAYMDKILESAKDDQWENAKKYYETIIHKLQSKTDNT